MGLVSQEPVLFSGTIRENIRYGRLDASDVDVEAAAKAANADTFIREFPDGYDEAVGERGVTLSGGQRQRVAIARALVNEPALLLADEPTGNLDSVTSEDVMRQFEELNQQGQTIVLVTHEHDIAGHAQRQVHLKDGLLEKDFLNPVETTG